MRLSAPILLAGLLVLLGLSLYLSIGLGSHEGGVLFDWDWPRQWLTTTDPVTLGILYNLRAPRAIAAMLAGCALAVSGLLLQTVSRNPLADPYLLGISGGAGLCVVLLHALPGIMATLGAWWLIPLAAFLGAQASVALVLRLARGSGGKRTMLGLILSGVIVNAFCAAMMTFLLTRFDPGRLRITTLWLAGGVGYTEWNLLLFVSLIVAGILLLVRGRAASINALSLGEDGALTVGVNPERTLSQAAILSSLLAGLAVSLAGLLGYVGLIVPHAVAFLVGRNLKQTLWLSALLGAVLLLLADCAARMVLAPQEIPVGVLTALLGAPLLLVLLRRQLGGSS